MTTIERPPRSPRLNPQTPWNGGRLGGSNMVTLADASRFASKHAGTAITPADFLRAAANGEIQMHAICPRTVTLEPCRETDPPLPMPEGSIPPLPVQACRALSNTGRASWRTLEGSEPGKVLSGVLFTFDRWKLPESEPDIETTSDDCRLSKWAVHALADAYLAEQEAAPVVTENATERPATPVQRLAGRAGVILRESNRNLLTPVIEAAQASCSDPFDAPAVFAALTQMATAKEKMRPLIGVAPEGIKWMDGHDETQFLSLKNLRERLKRVQERARKSAKERGKTRGL